MNTIPLIFNQREINRTVLGGKENPPFVALNVAVILLNRRGSQLRVPMIDSLAKCGFSSIVSIENNPDSYNIEDLSHKFPFVKFIIPLEKVTDGELINIGISEVKAPYALVLRDNISFSSQILTPQLSENLIKDETFCVVPRLISESNPSFPVIFSPTVVNSVFKTESSAIVKDGEPTLYPFDYIGLYNRQKFVLSGGYDYTITSSHWQNLDLSFRAWLWGEKFLLSTAFSLIYEGEPPVSDISADQSYTRFYLKNLLPRFYDDHAAIPRSSLFVYLSRSGAGFIESLNQFADARYWVDKNKYRFRFDAKYLTENWGKIK